MAKHIYHKIMDYKISLGIIWALVLVASCSAYVDETDMRGEFFFQVEFLSNFRNNFSTSFQVVFKLIQLISAF